MSDDVLNFESNEALNPPSGTKALVQIRYDDEGHAPDLSGRPSDFGSPFVSVQFEVVEGKYTGKRASLIYNIDPQNYKFRAIVKAATGVDVGEAGGQVSLGQINDSLVSGVFEAEIGPEIRKKEPTGYTAVEKLLDRVRDRSESAPVVADEFSAAAVEPDVGEEDIPF